MEDVTLKLTLQDDASSTLAKVASSARTASAQLQQTGKAIDNAFKSNAPKQFAADVGNAMDSAVSDAESLGTALDEALGGVDAGKVADAVDNVSEDFKDATSSAEALGKAVKEVDGAYQDLNGRWHDANGKFLKMPGDSGLPELADDAEKAGNEMEKASSKASVFAGALKKLFAVVSAAAIMSQIGGFAADSVELGRSYTAMVSEVQAISGASASEMAQLEATAREYGATTVFSASEAAEALKYMSLAGWDANQSSSALGGVLNLAAASGMGLGESSDMVTDYLSAFGMDASQSTYFADMLAYSQSSSNTTAAQLGEAYRNSAANMHAAGQDVETTTSLLEAMANQGYKGSEAGTALAAAMRDITQKMDDGAIKIGKTSVAVQDSEGNFRDLTDILMDVEDATDGMGDAQKAAALGETFTADSIKALNMILTEGMDKISGYEDELRSAGGTAEKMAAVMNDNLSGDMANMNSAFEEMQLQVFESMEEPLREGVQYLTSDIIPILTEWVPDAFGAAASGASKLGNALKPVIETVLKNPQGVATAFTSIGTGLAIFKGASFAKDMLSTADGASKLTASLTKLGNFVSGNAWTLGIAGLAAGVVVAKEAIDWYNGVQIDNNLSEHFGDISLDDLQVESLASQIIPVDITAKLDLANVEFDKADQLIEEGEAALEANNYLIWKVASVGLELSDSERESLITNGQEFVDSIKEAFQKDEYGAETVVKTLLGDQSGAVIETMQGWFDEDNAQLESLGEAITSILENSFGNGISGIDTESISLQVEGILQDAFSGGNTDTDTESLSATIASKLESSLGEGAELVDKDALAAGINDILQSAMTGEGVDTGELSSSITELFQDSIDTGVSDIDTATALSILQTKMMQMVNGVKQAELQGQLDWLSITSSGAALDSDSWASVVSQIGEYQTALMEADASAYQSLLTTVNQAVFNDPSRQGEADAIKTMIEAAYNDLNAGSLSAGWDWMHKSLNEAYEEELTALQGAMDNSSFKDKITGFDWQSGLAFAETDLKTTINEQFKDLGSSTQGALADRYETMLPSIQQMDKIISEAAEDGKAIPEALMESYCEAMALGAAAGDTEAMWQYMANEVAQDFPGMDEFVSTLESNGLDFSQFPEEIQKCFEKAFVDTNKTDYSSLAVGLAEEFSKEGGPDWDNISKVLYENGWEVDLSEVPITATGEPDISEIAKKLEGLEATGNKHTINGEDYIEYTAVSGDTLWHYAEQIAEDESQIPALVDQIAEASGISDKNNIGIGDKIMVPAEFALEADTSNMAEQTGQAIDELTQAAQDTADATDTNVTTTGEITGEYTAGEVTGADNAGQELANEAKDQAEATDPPPAEQQIPTTITFEVASLDDSALASAVTEQLKEGEVVTITVPADVVVAAGVIDTGEAVAAATTQTSTDLITAFATEFNAPGSVGVTLIEDNNVPEIYSEVGDAVKSAFAAGYSANAAVAVTLTANYSLANPVSTVTFGGGATGSAAITAALHADGGYFDEPHLGIVAEAGVGEYIIPMDGSDRSIDMWQDAGRMLGIDTSLGSPMAPISTSQDAPSVDVSGSGGEKTINLNINGSGKIQASGASKEEVLQIIMDNIKDVIIEMLQDDVLTEGDGTYDY